MYYLSGTHVFISAMGSKGDIHPLIGIGLELRRRGAKKITFLVNDIFKGLLTKYEFKHISTGTEENQIEFCNDERVWDPERDTADIGWVRTIRPAIEISYKVIEDAHKSGEAVLVIGLQSLMNGALMAAEVYDLPSAHITLAPWQVAAQSIIAPAAPIKWSLLGLYTKRFKKSILENTKIDYMNFMREKDHFWQLNGM